MKKILLKYLNLFALSGLLLAFVGCSDDNDSVTPGPGVEEVPSIGTYSFRGVANNIVSGVASVDGDYLTCVLSLEKMEEGKADTYLFFLFICIGKGRWWMLLRSITTTSMFLSTKIQFIITRSIKRSQGRFMCSVTAKRM